MVKRLAVAWLASLLAPQLQADAPLRLTTFALPPLVNVSQDAPPSGFAVEVIERVFERAGERYELTIQPTKRALRTAIDTPNTCVFPIDRSQERETSLRWIGPVSISQHAFYSHPQRPVPLRTLEDARRYSSSSYLGSGVGEYLQSLGFDVHLASKSELGLRMLAADRVDLWVADTRAAPILAQQESIELGEPELVFFTTLRSMGCNNGVAKERLQALEDALLELYHSGELQALMLLEQ